MADRCQLTLKISPLDLCATTTKMANSAEATTCELRNHCIRIYAQLAPLSLMPDVLYNVIQTYKYQSLTTRAANATVTDSSTLKIIVHGYSGHQRLPESADECKTHPGQATRNHVRASSYSNCKLLTAVVILWKRSENQTKQHFFFGALASEAVRQPSSSSS